MDFYKILKVPSKARQIDLDRAYHKLVKEAHFNPSINRKQVETAYRALSDATQRALYDAAKAESSKKSESTLAIRNRKKRSAENRRKIMSAAVVVLLLLTVWLYVNRFRHSFKTFEAGDELYHVYTDEPVGVVVNIDNNHSFANGQTKAYQVKRGDQLYWVPAQNLRTSAYKK